MTHDDKPPPLGVHGAYARLHPPPHVTAEAVADHKARQDAELAKMARLKALRLNARPAAAKVAALKDKHAFKTDMDDEARRHMFPQNASRAA